MPRPAARLFLHGPAAFVVVLIAGSGSTLDAQTTAADYERANALRARYEAAAVGMADPATWIGDTLSFWYRRSVEGGHEFIRVDARTRQKTRAFDHDRLAASLSAATGATYTAVSLPFSRIDFLDEEKTLEVRVAGIAWRCSLADYACQKRETPVGAFGGPGFSCAASSSDRPTLSPDGALEAFVLNYNIAVQEKGAKAHTLLSTDGSEGDCYDARTIVWAPDSTKLAAYRVRPGHRRMVHYVESSPEDQIQPKLSSRFYAKPGDVLDLEQPMIFHVAERRQFVVTPALFPNPYDLSPLVWRKDSRAVSFEYNQRGHEVYRIIEVDAATGNARAVVSEEPETFFSYSGKKFRHDVDDGAEVVWMSERDGWNHLYLYDGRTGRVKHQITQGTWAVREVVRVDEQRREIWFGAGGMDSARDPYFVEYFKIGFDGQGLAKLTEANAHHTLALASDGSHYVVTYSRVDLAPVMELRRATDGGFVEVVERGDLSALEQTGWRPPEVFVARGRDGTTDIWGVIYRPTTFDPDRRYPVIENIYAGPHAAFVPKTFSAYSQMQAQAEVGFIVVQIDGMGTSFRSKAFHDVAWQNLKDAGFPDRILWHRAVAAAYPSYDISRVGIYGTSAGGQSSLGALLFHPDFYHAAVSSVGCHDNRMDKIWWNEQWMGWPIGPHYAASSNVEHAHRLEGRLLLVVGELDTNVDPSSTLQVANALIKARKDFDLLFIPGGGHGAGGPYGERRRFDFFVRHLLGETPPDWNARDEAGGPTGTVRP